MTRALLVPDCGPGVGLGHLERMLALADALHPDVAATVVVLQADPALARRVADRGHDVVAASGAAADRAWTAAAATGPDLVVLDGYLFDLAVQRRLRAQAPLVVVDDLGLASACDLAVNPSPAGATMRPDGADAYLGGPAYALLASSFLAAREAIGRSGRPPHTVLVSTGATNLQGIVGRVATELLESDAELDIVAVVGPGMKAADLPDDPRLRSLLAPPTLAAPLAAATVYVGAAGTTAVQAACVGVPAVITPAADNQVQLAAALVAAGCAVAAPPDDLSRECLRLLADPGRCEVMASRGRALIDGRGAPRVADAVRRLIGARAA